MGAGVSARLGEPVGGIPQAIEKFLIAGFSGMPK